MATTKTLPGNGSEAQAELAGSALLSDYFTQEQLAAELGVSWRTIHRWHELRIGPPRTRLGKLLLYHKESVREWMRANEIPDQRARGRRARAMSAA